MKKIALQNETKTSQFFNLMCILLSFAFIFNLSGCITSRAVEFAERKASPSFTHTYWNLKKVRSAVEQENGDISVCFASLLAVWNGSRFCATHRDPPWI